MTTRKTKLRLLSALLAVAMMLTLLPTAAFAADATGGNCGKDGADVTWSLEDGTLTISGKGAMEDYDARQNKSPWSSNASDIKIVVVKNGVTSIGNYTFSRCNALTSIVLPDSVTNIGHTAFYGCKNCTSITIPKGVTNIDVNAFANCSGLTSIMLPDGVTNIGESAFGGCSGLTTITIPNSVTNIGDGAFVNCSGLTSIAIPNKVSSIGEETFAGCSNLANVEIPSSVTSIGDSAFAECSKLSHIYYGGEKNTIKWSDAGVEENKVVYTRKVTYTNGLGTETKTVEYGSTIAAAPELPQPDGYTFAGWYYDDNGTETKFEFGESGTKVTSDITLTAKWNIDHHNVTFVNDGEDAGTVKDVEYNTTISADKAPETPTKEGYTFDGWYYDDNGAEKKFEFGENGTKVTGDMTLTAKWTPNSYKLTVDDEDKGKQDYNADVEIDEPTKTGYTFAGWTVETKNATLKKGDDGKWSFKMPAGEVDLTANWNANEYTVTFDANGHGTAPEAEKAKYNTSVDKPDDPAAEGYTFDDWYTEKECTNAFDFTTPITQDITLFAKWTEVKKPDPTPGDDKPTTPEEPSKPEQPGDDKPTTPTKPEEPAKPGEDKPSTPETPSKPSEPEKSSTPETPVEPSKPDTPETPDQPSKPEEPKPVTYTISIDNGKAYLDDGETEINTAKEGQKVTVKVNPEAITDGFEFDKWEVVSGDVMLDDEASPETSFEMPASDVELKATVKAVEPAAASLTKLEQAAVVSTGAVVAGAGVATVGFAAYGIGTELTARLMLPAGAAMPTTCGELSKVLWKNAGCPALPADAPLSEDELILNWAIDNELMDKGSTLEKHVSAVTVIKALSAEKKL